MQTPGIGATREITFRVQLIADNREELDEAYRLIEERMRATLSKTEVRRFRGKVIATVIQP